MNSTGTITQITDHRALAFEFQERGFLIIPNALSGEQIAELNRVVDRDLEKHGDAWVNFDESLMETPDVISRTAEFDFTIENPVTFGILRSFLGELITFEERSEEHTSELQSHLNLVCRLLLEKKKKYTELFSRLADSRQ